MSDLENAGRLLSKALKERQQFSDAFDIEFKENLELQKEIKELKLELEAEKKIVNYYADNGYSVAVKRVKERTQ